MQFHLQHLIRGWLVDGARHCPRGLARCYGGSNGVPLRVNGGACCERRGESCSCRVALGCDGGSQGGELQREAGE